MTGARNPQKSFGNLVFIALRWIAALAVLALLLHFFPLAPLRSALAHVPLTRFLAILLLYLLGHAAGIVKWRMVVNAAGAELSLAASAQCYAGGLFGTLFLPSIIGGDVVRLAVGLRRSPRPAAVLAGNVADRFLDVTAQGPSRHCSSSLFLSSTGRSSPAVPFAFAGGWRGYAMHCAQFPAVPACFFMAGSSAR